MCRLRSADLGNGWNGDAPDQASYRPSQTWDNAISLAQITDLDHWFMDFADARNKIIHEGLEPPLIYSGLNTAYKGHFVFTAEFLLRAVVKVSLMQFGYKYSRARIA